MKGVMNMFYYVTMSLDKNTCFLGMAKSVEGCVRITKKYLPGECLLPHEINIRCIHLQSKTNPGLWVVFNRDEREWNSDKAWVVTKRSMNQKSEDVQAIFKMKSIMENFLRVVVEDPIFSVRSDSSIIEVDGFRPHTRHLDENPELNRVHYTIYEPEVEE